MVKIFVNLRNIKRGEKHKHSGFFLSLGGSNVFTEFKVIILDVAISRKSVQLSILVENRQKK